MAINFDPARNESNLAKHGVALAQAAWLEWEPALTWLDTRQVYDETFWRYCAPRVQAGKRG